jgi:tRNA(adenine34) deaminase
LEAQTEQDRHFMRAALAEAAAARDRGEVPIGAVLVLDGEIIGRGHNLRETGEDPTAHAELLAIRQAAATIGHGRLLETPRDVTLEPGVMCMGALILARVPRLVFGCRDPRAGACGSIYNFPRDERFNLRVVVTAVILEEECSALLRNFFIDLRARRREEKSP